MTPVLRSRSPSAAPLQQDHDLPWPVVYKRLRQAKRLTLRTNPVKQEIIVSFPWRGSQREAARFVATHREWLLGQIAQTVPAYTLTIGSHLPVHGQLRQIVHQPATSRGVQVTLTSDSLIVTGGMERVPRAVHRFLKQLAKTEIERLIALKAPLLDRRVGRLTIRDTASRWGSCTPEGDLNFCWRLILAPPEVLDYVVGHEMAHLIHMHHQPTFWALCRQLTPHTTLGKTWLRQHGPGLRVSL